MLLLALLLRFFLHVCFSWKKKKNTANTLELILFEKKGGNVGATVCLTVRITITLDRANRLYQNFTFNFFFTLLPHNTSKFITLCTTDRNFKHLPHKSSPDNIECTMNSRKLRPGATRISIRRNSALLEMIHVNLRSTQRKHR